MSAKNQPENDPLILNELKIPGRTGPVSETPKVWGINRAAALDNFPRQGLLCQAGPWAPMNPHDRLVIYKNKTQEILREIVNTGEVNTELQMFVEARHITEGSYTLSYSVTRLGGVAEDSLETQVLVKLTRPGGEDHSGEPGHPDLVMTIPEEILKGGIDEDNVASGVPITIGKPDDKPPYPFAAAGDVIRVSWGGVFVLSAPLTQAQADGTESIIVKIDAATIRNAGDSDDSGLAVVFEVYDLVDNRSSDWSVEQRVLVAVDKTRLVAPLLKEAQNNVLDVDKLGDADGTAQVWVSGASFKVGDIPILKIRGTPQEGPPVDIEVPGDPLVSVPTTHETKIDNRILRQLAKSQIALSYRLEKADGSADLPAKTQFISVIGEVQRLEAPVALDAKQGALDPLLPQVRIEVPFDASFAAGQVINLFWLGTRPDLEAYLPTLPPRLITQGDYDAKEPLLIIVDKKHLTPIIGGKLELYYQLLTEDSVFNQMDRFQQTRAIRESKHADILQIGEARKELPEPTVDGVVDGVLPPDTNGTNLIVGYLKTVKGDEVIYHWEGSKTGMHSDSLKLNDFTAGQPVPFTIKADLIKGNEGGTVKASYELKRAAGGTSYSDTLEFNVGPALEWDNRPITFEIKTVSVEGAKPDWADRGLLQEKWINRPPSGGVLPYTYTSSDEGVAIAKGGQIVSVRPGRCVITLQDEAGTTKTLEVTVSATEYKLLYSPILGTLAEFEAWAEQVGGTSRVPKEFLIVFGSQFNARQNESFHLTIEPFPNGQNQCMFAGPSQWSYRVVSAEEKLQFLTIKR